MKKNEILYNAMVDEVEDYAILLLDLKGNVISWNKGSQKIKGYKKSEIIGKNFNLFYTPEDREKKRPEKLLKKAAITGKAKEEGWRVKKDGTLFWANVLITAIHDEDNKVIGFTKVTRDLTERRDAEETKKNLIQTREALMRIFNASPSSMVLAGIESGGLVAVNNSFCSTFGYTSDEAVGYTADELGFVSPEVQARVFGKLKHKGYLKNEELPCRTKDGTAFDTMVSVEPFEMEGKACFLAIFHDITAIKKLNREIEKKNEELLDLNHEKDRFVGMVSHDLQNGISSIMLSLGLMTKMGNMDEKMEVYVRRMQRSAANMSSMLTNFLTVNRIQRGIIKPLFSFANLGDLVKEVVDGYEYVAARKNIKLKFANHCKESFFKTDRSYVGIIADNLVSNAIKYSPRDKGVNISVGKEDGRYTFKVQDYGVGIPPSDMPRLYGRFQKLTPRPTGNEPTNGLGLSIVKDLVDSLNAHIECESKPGAGTTFTVEF